MKEETVPVRMSGNLKTKAKKSAKKKELSLSSWIRIAIIDKLKRDENE